MATLPTFSFPCLEVSQPIGVFYVGVMNAADLVEISYADCRRLTEERRAIEVFSGIQRPLSEARVKELKEFVSTVDASFPTSIILHVEGKDADFREGGFMELTRGREVAKILDGQHRIAGLEGFVGSSFQMQVTIFVDMELEDQALLFATVNLKQTKVNKSLAYDLFDFATSRSPQKTLHQIARLLNAREDSPFYFKIKILGKATKGRDETITQATFVEQLMPLISANPIADRDAIKRGKPPAAISSDRAVLRSYFLEERDAELARMVWNFFEAVEKRWPRAWAYKAAGQVLNRTTGFSALVRLFGDLVELERRVASESAVVSSDRFLLHLLRIPLQDDDFAATRYLPGAAGAFLLYRTMKAAVDPQG